MAKKYLDINVLDAAIERIRYLFDEFDNVLVAFSGGKDSGVALELCYDYARDTGQLDKLAVFYMDFEAQYSQTIDYIRETFERLDGIRRYWLCVPVVVNSSLVPGGKWHPWDPEDRENWVRDLPDTPYLVTAEEAQAMGFTYPPDMLGRRVRVKFGDWFGKTYGSTAVVVGIRADESLDRYRAIAGRKYMYKDHRWISAVKNHRVSAYPIYDWTLNDVWGYFAKEDKPYNRLYDDYHTMGMKLGDMRVAHPFCLHGVAALKHYKELDPDIWARMSERYDGANFAAIYGDTEAMGYKRIALPDGYTTWESYFKHLMTTLSDEQREHYQTMMDRRLAAVDDDTAETMYRVMCVAVLRNDYQGRHASSHIARQKRERRKATAAKWRDLL